MYIYIIYIIYIYIFYILDIYYILYILYYVIYLITNLSCFTEMKHGRKKTPIPHLMLRWGAMMVQNSASLLEYI